MGIEVKEFRPIDMGELNLWVELEKLRRKHQDFCYQLKVSHEHIIILTNVPIGRTEVAGQATPLKNCIYEYIGNIKDGEKVRYGSGTVDDTPAFGKEQHTIKDFLIELTKRVEETAGKPNAFEFQYTERPEIARALQRKAQARPA